ncbi:uncharacterized protein C8R40DRAFT_1164980 [Lentinula edodes]|uniref:uncharacterized protein n=1 Tax=Lentinula edodes TaxID=5353 RepID=UPI001E8DADE0|nr:uncharacterized protein C8R40DRAFT_1164980 [Lentinula edodes]KAH7881569.1 hypothetical protein C8R40DRAFT_1164980 [Lentinula edodes]
MLGNSSNWHRWLSIRHMHFSFKGSSPRWLLNLVIFALGIASTIAGYKNNTVPVTVIGAIAALGSLISSSVTPLSKMRGHSIELDLETQDLMLDDFSPSTYHNLWTLHHYSDSPSGLDATLAPSSTLVEPRLSVSSLDHPLPDDLPYTINPTLPDYRSPSSAKDSDSDSDSLYSPTELDTVPSLRLPFPYTDSSATSTVWEPFSLTDDLIDFESVLRAGKPSLLHHRSESVPAWYVKGTSPSLVEDDGLGIGLNMYREPRPLVFDDYLVDDSGSIHL